MTVSNGKFDTLYQGVYLGGITPVNGGPTGVRIITNVFDKISVHKSRVETFHNEISVVSPETTIEQIQAATSSIEERQKLIDVGVQLANDFIKKHM